MVFDAVSKQKTNMLSLAPFRDTIGQRFKMEGERHFKDLITFSDTLPTISQAAQLLIDEALNRAGGNQSIAAGLLGMSHQALNKRLQRNREHQSDT